MSPDWDPQSSDQQSHPVGKKKKKHFLLDPHLPPEPSSLPSSPTLARARVHTQLNREKGGLACLIVFLFWCAKSPRYRRENREGLWAQTRGELPRLRSPSSEWSHYCWSHWMYHSSRGREGAEKRRRRRKRRSPW